MSVETYKVETSTQSPTHEVKTTKEKKKEREARPPQPQPLLGSAESRERLRQAEAIVKRNTLWAVGAGALIFPVVDVVAASAVQLKMLKNLSDLYGVNFSEGIAKKLVSSLLMSLGGVAVGVGAASLIKLIPGVGSALGVLTFPLSVAAFTNALGRVFIMHFESGGTLLDFDPKKMQEHFKNEFEKARLTVDQLRKEDSQVETTVRAERRET
ncbi:YcjF family protein [Melittangium boletus]|uniref:GTPase n=1 Tax=Melittangium boletus DSM 14713 TaxID=1294270 RepID=A0A250IPK6_9BACT|nr:DUF697 domain-containing protein [Melittangium boletus]ATB33172.1 hypothetical protein MEBOL_006661 [Melittangium boletus DSM 14713]